MNTAPVAGDDIFTTAEDVVLMLTSPQLLANDTDAETPTMLAISAVQNAIHGTVTRSGASITFVPEPDYSGMASFEYVVSDGFLTDIGAVTITITPVDDPPIAQAQSRSTNRNTPLAITLTATDVDTPLMNLTYMIGTGPTHGQLVGAPTPPLMTYTPTAGYSGPDSFTFTARDSTTTSAPATVSLTVVAVPICNDGIPEGTEECDDGNLSELDGCTTQCRRAKVCNVTAFPGGDRFAVNPATGACYVSFDSELTTFAAAQTSCVSAGGYLATITSAAEQTIVSQVQNSTENPWIGGTDDANTTDAIFTWVTAEPFAYTNFAPGQPDDDAPFGGNGDCLHLVNAAAQWNDTNCAISTFVTGRICEMPAATCGNGAVEPGEECDDNNMTSGDGCSSACKTEALYFSEYVEGSSNNKAVELYNSASVPRSLTGCTLRLYFNGATSSTSITLTGTIAAHDVLVVCHSMFSTLALCDVSTASLNFNGDDAVELACGTQSLDTIGQVGVDPGAGWGMLPSPTTVDATLRRKCSVTRGDAVNNDVFVPATEWNAFATDTFSDLGSYTCP